MYLSILSHLCRSGENCVFVHFESSLPFWGGGGGGGIVYLSILSRLCRSGDDCIFVHLSRLCRSGRIVYLSILYCIHQKFHARTIFFLVLFPTCKFLVPIEQSTVHPLVFCIASFHSLVILACCVSLLPVFIVLSSSRVLYCQFS